MTHEVHNYSNLTLFQVFSLSCYIEILHADHRYILELRVNVICYLASKVSNLQKKSSDESLNTIIMTNDDE